MSRWLPFRRDPGLQLLALYLLCVGPVIAAALLFDTSASARLEGDGHAAELARAPDVQALETGRPALLFAAVSAARQEINLVYVNDAKIRSISEPQTSAVQRAMTYGLDVTLRMESLRYSPTERLRRGEVFARFAWSIREQGRLSRERQEQEAANPDRTTADEAT